MRKSEVQPLTTFISSRLHVRQLFFSAHIVPNIISLLISPNIVGFSKEIEKDVENADSHENTVAPAVCEVSVSHNHHTTTTYRGVYHPQDRCSSR